MVAMLHTVLLNGHCRCAARAVASRDSACRVLYACVLIRAAGQHLAREHDTIHLVNVVPLDATYSAFNFSPVNIAVSGELPALDPELRRLAVRIHACCTAGWRSSHASNPRVRAGGARQGSSARGHYGRKGCRGASSAAASISSALAHTCGATA